MKRSFILKLLTAFTFCLIIPISSLAKECNVSLLNTSNCEETNLTFNLGDYEMLNTNVNGESCTFITLDDAAYLEEKGLPMLPIVVKSIVIPDNAAMGLEIKDIKFKELKINKVIPSKGVIYRNQNPADIPYTFSNFYSENKWFPEKVILLSEPYILRNMRGIVVHFHPFQFNPARGILKVVESIVLKVKKIGIGKINVLTSQNKLIPPSFDHLYNSHFLNYQYIRPRYDFIDDGDKMIVITASDFKSIMEPFVEWKNQKGIETKLYEYPSETGGTGTSNIMDFIKDKFDSDKITYILLVGDNGDIPSITVSNDLSDPSYILLAGSDSYPDAFIGRFCSSSNSDINAMVDKVLKYEKEPDPNGEWYHKATGIASDEGNPSDKTLMEGFREKFLAYNYTEVDKIYDPDASRTDVINAFNDGRSWMNYMGHGNTSSWGTSRFGSSNISSLTNVDMIPVVISISCLSGLFSTTCMGETFTRSSGKGALVFFGSSISQAWRPPQYAMKEMVEELITKDACISVGGIIYNGECKMLDNPNSSSTFKTWILFGDPSVMHFTDTPKELNVTYPQSIETGSQDVEISFGESIIGRICLYSEKNGILGSKILSASSSSVTLSINITSDEKKIIMTVTGFNKMPVIKEITVGQTNTISDNFIMDQSDFIARPSLADKNRDVVNFNIKTTSDVKPVLKIYNLLGNVVYEDIDGTIEPWNITDIQGKKVATGIYLAVLRLKYKNGTDKMFKTLVRIK